MPHSFLYSGFSINGNRPFQPFSLISTESEYLNPMAELVLTGLNGTGKSDVLKMLHSSLETDSKGPTQTPATIAATLLSRFQNDDSNRSCLTAFDQDLNKVAVRWFENQEDVEISDSLESDFWEKPESSELEEATEPATSEAPCVIFLGKDEIQINHAPAERLTATLGEIHETHRRTFLDFLKQSEVIEMQVGDATALFHEQNPNPLSDLESLWNDALKPAGIQFCPETNRFLAHGSSDALAFESLCGGIQKFLNWTGIVKLTLNTHPDQSIIVFSEEPETGLHQDFSGEMLTLIQGELTSRNSQLILVTYNEAVADRFPPEANFHFSLDESGVLSVVQGTASEEEPEDKKKPNTETTKIARAPSARSRYSHIKRAIEESDDQEELANLVDELIAMRKR